MTEIVLIAALARNRALGKDNRLLWHLPEDQRHFRQRTMGSPVIMGRRTWDSLPVRFRPLPGRRNIVVTRDAGWSAPGAERAASPRDALSLVAASPQAFVIGGAELYAAMLGDADELCLTEIDRDFDGDCFFPPVDPAAFTEIARQTHCTSAPDSYNYSFVTYRRNR